jgi:hypothetical protein
MISRRWDPCVSSQGTEVDSFAREYFADPRRRVALLAGRGFDPRTTRVAEMLAATLGSRMRAIFFREQRSGTDAGLSSSADTNAARLTELVPSSRVETFPVFSNDNATIGGRRVIQAIEKESWQDVSDIVVDLSALSLGVGFPLVKFIYETAKRVRRNLHVMVTDNPELDADLVGVPSEKAEPVFGFKGQFGLDEQSSVTVLWLPQLARHRQKVFQRIHATLTAQQEVDVCPILPFPSRNPRRGDDLIEHYQEEFESIWRVDAQDIVYVDERRPLDFYRTALDIDDARRRVFRKLGGSMTVLSPSGGKVLSLGALMAALERDFPVMYVETLSYATKIQPPAAPGELVHVWLYGEAYGDAVEGVS